MKNFWMVMLGLSVSWAIAPLNLHSAIPPFPDLGTPALMTTGGRVLAKSVPLVDPAFPDVVKKAVVQAVVRQTGLKPDQLTVLQATSKIWSDGCLGLGPPDRVCPAVLVQGWEVVVIQDRQEWVYRTNFSGQTVRFDPAGSHLSRLVDPSAEQISLDQLPQKLDKAIVLREMKSGGIAGVTETLTLWKDGRLIRQSVAGPTTTSGGLVVRTVAKSDVKAFKKRLEKLHFGQFGGLRYPPPPGSADYFTVTLGNRQTTVQYTELNPEGLPEDLQAVIQAWRELFLERGI